MEGAFLHYINFRKQMRKNHLMLPLPEGLQALKQVAKEVGLDLRGAYLNLDGGYPLKAGHRYTTMVSDL